jgi:hypothetical protein
MDTRWENVDALLKRTERTRDEQLVRAAQQIVEQRFAFPTKDFPAYRAHLNAPDVTMAVKVGDEEIAPTIVVVERLNTGDTRLVMTAEVCTHEQVNDGEAKRVWSRVASIPNQAFYIYVPVGYGAEVKAICKRLKVRPEGFRTYRNTPRGFEINDVSEPPSPLAPLMPGFVRRTLSTP